MRWCFTDRINTLDAWKSVSGVKVVSLEEYCLCDPLGREGVLPEAIVIESSVELLRWLVLASSDFKKSCILSSLEDFTFSSAAGMGDALAISIQVASNCDDEITATCSVSCGEKQIASGRLNAGFFPVEGLSDPEILSEQFKELYGQAQ